MLSEEEKKLRKLESSRKYYLKNKEKLKKTRHEYYLKNKEFILNRHKKRLENKEIALKDKIRQKQYREEDKDKQKIKSNNYYINNKHKVLAKVNLRRSSKLNRTPKWLNLADKFEIECIYKYAKSLNNIGLDYHVDHIVPLNGKKVSGLHIGINLQVIPAKQNLSKGINYERNE